MNIILFSISSMFDCLFARAIDDSLLDFLSELTDRIDVDRFENSFIDFKYTYIQKNKLYHAISDYKDNGTVFYSSWMSQHPEFHIKRIDQIKIVENRDLVVVHGKEKKEIASYFKPNGTYNLHFTVYFEKKKTNTSKQTSTQK